MSTYGKPARCAPRHNVPRFQGCRRTGHPEGPPCTALNGPEFSASEALGRVHKRELGQRRAADVGFRANTGRSADPRWMSAGPVDNPTRFCGILKLPDCEWLPAPCRRPVEYSG